MNSITLARQAMATRFEIVLHGDDPATLRAAGEEALDEIDRLESRLSLYRAGSEIAQLNARAAREPVRVSPEVFALLERAQRLHAETGGAFDITIAPLVRCWGFMGGTNNQGFRSSALDQAGRAGSLSRHSPKAMADPLPAAGLHAVDGAHGVTRPTFRTIPSPQEIDTARAAVGMHLVELDARNRTVRFSRDGVMLDLGAIGKGYAIERAAALLRDAGVTSALIHGGTSTVQAIGSPPDADHWKVAVDIPQSRAGVSPAQGPAEDPENRRDTCSTLLAVVPLKDQALSVSAVWGRAFQSEGRTLGHVLDPRTGQPVTGSLLAAVVLPSATETDALSTALLVQGAAGFASMAALRPAGGMLLATDEAGALNVKTHGAVMEAALKCVENEVFRD